MENKGRSAVRPQVVKVGYALWAARGGHLAGGAQQLPQ